MLFVKARNGFENSVYVIEKERTWWLKQGPIYL